MYFPNASWFIREGNNKYNCVLFQIMSTTGGIYFQFVLQKDGAVCKVVRRCIRLGQSYCTEKTSPESWYCSLYNNFKAQLKLSFFYCRPNRIYCKLPPPGVKTLLKWVTRFKYLNQFGFVEFMYKIRQMKMKRKSGNANAFGV